MNRLAVFAVRLVLVVSLVWSPATASPTSFADLADRVLPSVVNVATLPQGPRSEPRALGSGFVVAERGLIVTNNHVVDGATNLVVTFGDELQYDVQIRGLDVETDLAVLEIVDPDRKFSPLRFGDSKSARVGDWVLAIGNPFGVGSSVSAGIISGQSRDIGAGLYDKFIQTDAAINRGNSGGPLFDRRGRVIGVNTVIFSQTGGSVGVGFAIPSEIARPVVEQLIEKGRTTRGYLGAFLEDVDPGTRDDRGLARNQGALVTGIAVSDGPAALAGFEAGDVILSFDGKRVRGRGQLSRLIAATPVGEAVDVEVDRGGERVTLEVTLASREDSLAMGPAPAQESPLASGGLQLSGLTLNNVSSELAQVYRIDPQSEGVLVTGVSHHLTGSVLQPGDIILEVGWDNAESVETMSDHLNDLRKARSGPVKILVKRGDNLFYETIRP